MLSKPALLFWFLLFFGIPSYAAGIFGNAKKKEKEVIERLAQTDTDVKNLEGYKKYLQKELSILPFHRAAVAKCIENVLVGNRIAFLRDSLDDTSTNLFKGALSAAEQLGEPEITLWVTINYAFYLYTYRKYEQSYPLFMRCIQISSELPVEKTIQPLKTYKKTAFFLMTVGDNVTAEIYFKKAMAEVPPISKDAAAILDNLGAVWMSRDNFAVAEEYFAKAKAISQQVNDELRYAKVLGNLASLRFKQKKYAQARTLFLEDLAISEKGEYDRNSLFALVWLIRVSLANDQFEEARRYLVRAREISSKTVYLKSTELEISTLWLELATKTKNEKEELLARRQIDELSKKLSYLDGEDVKVKVHWAMEKNNLQLKLDLEKAQRERETAKKILAFILSSLLVAGIALIVFWYRKKYQKQANEFNAKIEQLLKEKEKSERRLVESSSTLDSYKTYLQEKNLQIKELELEISAIEESFNGSEKFKNKMQAILQSHLVDNRTWAEFKTAFIQENAEYYTDLMDNFSDLTDANLRVIFLMKMGMNNGDIARVLGITLDAIKKAKQRLRKKYGDNFAKMT